MSEPKAVRLYNALTNVGDDLIEEAQKVRTHKKITVWQRWGMRAACFFIITLMMIGTAFAASESFREAVISFFFPIYAENQLQEIDEGHRTGSFSMENTLFTFLDKFNSENMGNGIHAKRENGFEYAVLSNGENLINVVVECNTPDDKLLVIMEREDYKKTAGLWQVTAYQLLSSETASERIDSGR